MPDTFLGAAKRAQLLDKAVNDGASFAEASVLYGDAALQHSVTPAPALADVLSTGARMLQMHMAARETMGNAQQNAAEPVRTQLGATSTETLQINACG